jgi:4,5-DOPA dioxygenase extradiol
MSLGAFFLSHGAPDIMLRDTEASRFFKSMDFSNARAIVMVSAHWMTDEPTIMASALPGMIYDFGGFDPALRRMIYPAKGAPDLAVRIKSMMRDFAPKTKLDSERGFDHGAWVPMIIAEPQARIPLIQVSIQPHKDAQYHYEIGQRLASLADDGIVFVASGNATHNLRAVFQNSYKDTPKEVFGFNDWLYETLCAREDKALLGWEKAPYALWNHPTNDHILPLFTILGATHGQKKAQRLHHSFDLAVLSMDSYQLA